MGICTNCGKTTGENEVHACNEDFVTLARSDYKLFKIIERFIKTQSAFLTDDERDTIATREVARDKVKVVKS